MPGPRRLWTGPHGSSLRERVLDEWGHESSGLWIVPTPLARDQVVRSLGLRQRMTRGLRVWCWDDLWRAVREERGDGPAQLSPAATRAALSEAIDRARRDGVLAEAARVVDWPGFRRRLVARIATWTRAERSAGSELPDPDPTRRAQWAIFGRYRAVLDEIHAEDAEGLAVWAARALLHNPPASLQRP